MTQAGVDIPALRADAARPGPALAQALEHVMEAWLDGKHAGARSGQPPP